MNARARGLVSILLCGVLWCGGCATYSATDVVPHLDATGTGALVVMTHDQRPYIVSGGTEPTFVGLLRSPMGIPWAVHTDSKRPFADDMTQVLCQALTSRGFHCVPVLVAASVHPPETRRKLQEHAGTPALVVTLQEWKSDTHTDTALAYDATLRVLDPQGTPMAESRIQGRDVLGGTFWNSGSFARTAVPQALKKKLEELLNDPVVITALQTVNRPSAVPQQAAQPPVAPPPAMSQPPSQPPDGSQRSSAPERTAPFAVVHLQPQYDAFRLFVQPHTGAARLSSVSAGVSLKVIEAREQWLYVETPDEQRGWILREWIQE